MAVPPSTYLGLERGLFGEEQLHLCLPLAALPLMVGAHLACPSSRGRMTLALVVASIGSLAMCLGLDALADIHPMASAMHSLVPLKSSLDASSPD
ncbi:MAG: hypothetical protein MZW92_20315 [Comamonadaceae bacterium]|nr:hypothetical protein [Comamonadaceae bacterium]